MYQIGLFSQITKVTIKALRYYDDIDLLKPAKIDDFTGYRYYTSDQTYILHRILVYRQMGFGLEEVRSFLCGGPKKILLENKKAELQKQISEMATKLSQVEHYLGQGDAIEMSESKYEVLLKSVPEVIVASVRTIISSHNALFEFMPSMGKILEELGCECAIPEYCFNVYHAGEYQEKNIDVEICEAVVEKKESCKGITFKTFSAIPKAACVLHKGPYATLPQAYGALMKWMESNGFEPNGNPRESYIDGIWNKDLENDWLTEIQFPIKIIE